MNNLLLTFSRRKFLLTTGIGFLGAITIKGCESNSTSSNQQTQPSSTSQGVSDDATLYKLAKQEGKLVYYMGFLTQDILNDISSTFTKKYPGIEFQGVRKTAGAIFQQLTQEMQAGISNADVFSTADIGQVIKLKDDGKLTQYVPAGKESLLAQYRNLDSDNFYNLGALLPSVIGYSTQKVQEAEVPKTWKEMLNPKFKNQISVGSALASGQVGVWALAIAQKYGWDQFFPQFNQQNPKLGRSINDVTADLISGERTIGVGSLGQFLAEKAKGNPIGIKYPSDGTLIVTGPIAILKTAPHPNAARLFLNFMMSKEYSQLIAKHFEQPLRADVALPGSKSLKDIPTLAPKPKEIQTGLPQIKKKWKELFSA